MERTTLEEYLQKEKFLQSGIIVKSNLIEKLEVYGYANACNDDNIYGYYYGNYYLNGIVDKENKGQIVLSNYILQVTTHHLGKEIRTEGLRIPVFKTLSISEVEENYNVEDLYIPSLVNNRYYIEIKRRESGSIFTDYKLKKANFPVNITALEGKAIFNAPAGHIQLFDKDGVMKSVGENIMVVCRYLHEVSGHICYTQFNLNEVFIDD